MFKQWKEDRENKRDILLYQAFLLRELTNIVLEFKQSQDVAKQTQEKAKKAGVFDEDAINILNTLKGLDQKELVSKLVDVMKQNETVAKNETIGK